MKSPIPYTYDLNTKSAQKVICVTHTDDNSVDVIQLHVVQNGALIDFSGNTIIARMVMSRTHELLSDNVVCTIDEVTKDVMIPIDRMAVSTRRGLMLIEVSVRGVLPQKLTLQFPLLVRVNGSILDDAEITPESQGTIPELLIAAAEELRRVQGFITSDDVYDILDSALQGAQNVAPSLYVKRKGDNYALVYEDSEDVLHELFDFSNLPSGASDYTDLENKPQINNVTLSGNKSSDDLGLQKKLTAGTNITLGNDGTISASGGVTSYNDLTNLPKVSDGNASYEITNILDFPDFNITLHGWVKELSIKPLNSGKLENGDCYYIKEANTFHTSFNLNTPTLDAYGKWLYFDANSATGLPNGIDVVDTYADSQRRKLILYSCRACQIYNVIANVDLPLLQEIYWTDSALKNHYAIRTYIKKVDGTRLFTDWIELSGGSQIVSGVVNQNGTITFTDSGGNTFTTSGSSVIGADGFSPVATVTQTASGATVSITDKNGTTTANISNGADGQDYVLTAQDKTDIANIVLQSLPTVEGVLYGD